MKHKQQKRLDKNQRTFISIVVSMVLIGLILVVVKAGGNTASVQPENGNLAGGASQCQDAQASGGKCVLFGAGNSGVVQVSQLPALLGNYSEPFGPYNSTIFCGDQLTSAFDPNINAYRQYFVYGGVDRQQYITTRILPNGNWQAPTNLKAVLGNVNMAPDGHKCLVAAVDPEGFIHVTANQHDDPLRMARSTTPYNITSFVNVATMVNQTTENEVTYPTFFKTKDGVLMLAYRNGYAGSSGKWYLNKWDPYSGNPGHWVRVSQVTDASGESFYPWRITVDRSNTASKGRIHFFGTWRVDGVGAIDTNPPNEDLLDFFSDDNGITWKQYGNTTPLTLPIRFEDGARILNTGHSGTTNRFILNNGGLDIDAQGHPHALVNMSTTAGTKTPGLYHVWHDGTVWHMDVLSGIGARPRSSVFSDSTGKTWGLISPTKDKIFLTDLTPGSVGYGTGLFPVAQGLTYGGLAAFFDSNLLYEQNKLSFMFTQLGHADPVTEPDDNYRQPAYIETIPVDQISTIEAGSIAIPGLSGLYNQTVTNRTLTGTALQKLLSSTPVTSTQPLYVRLTATARVAATGTTLRLKAVKTTGNGDVAFGRLDFTHTNPTTASTPWLPVQLGGSYSGVLSAAAQIAAGSGNGTIDSLKFEVSSLIY